jgi:hypothetical protein
MAKQFDDMVAVIDDPPWSDVIHSLCDWVDIDPAACAATDNAMRANNDRALKLETARRSVAARLDDARRVGMPTADLERERDARQAQARSFLTSLAGQRGAPRPSTRSGASAAARPTLARYLACFPDMHRGRPATSAAPSRTTSAPHR